MKKNQFDALSTEELEQLLRKDCKGTSVLPVEDVLAICEILTRRQAVSLSPQAAWQQFLHCYAPRNNRE